MAAKKMYIVTKTIHTLDKDGKTVVFLASSEPQDLGSYGASAVKAKCAVLVTSKAEANKADDDAAADDSDDNDE